MQAGLSPADRKLLLATGSAIVILAIAIVLATPGSETQSSPIPSSYVTARGGAQAAFLLLQRIGIKVERWQEPPFRLLDENPKATLVVAEPARTPSRAEAGALQRFVKRGGRVLFCGRALGNFFPGAYLQDSTGDLAQYSTVDRETPTQIELRPKALWQKLTDEQSAVYGDSDGAVVVAWPIGSGEVVWWAAATPLINDEISHANNLALFLNSIGSGRRVFWDEYFHGESRSLWEYASRIRAIRWAAAQFAILGAVSLLAFSRRSGPVIAPGPVSRLSPLEFVDTLGGLYQRAKRSSLAVDTALGELRLQLTRRLGLPITISDRDLAHAAAERLDWNGAEFERILSESRTPTARTALALVQSLHTYTWNIYRR